LVSTCWCHEPQSALEVLWRATGYIAPPRLHSFVPELLDRLTRDGELALAPDLDKLVRHVSVATLGRLLAPARATRPPRGASTTRADGCFRGLHGAAPTPGATDGIECTQGPPTRIIRDTRLSVPVT
jgi:hypothetical protein